jgi:hypothetical protein
MCKWIRIMQLNQRSKQIQTEEKKTNVMVRIKNQSE